jgi:CheY-like chemotaxis protein
MPGMNRHEVARAFRADEVLCRAFLVALSGYAAPEDVERASQAGFQRNMPKPLHFEHLSTLLASA